MLIKGGYLLTMDAGDRRFRGDLLIEDDRIKSIEESINEPADKVIDARGMLVLPGFVQSHIHLCQSLLRGQADDQDLVNWLVTITTLESLHTPETLYASARLGLAEMIKAGATGVIDMGTLHHQDSVFRAIEESGRLAKP
jgi:cytosine/adenosine deaminase-related metal-dependent hydrolase